MQPASRILHVNGLRLHALEWGEQGRPVLVLLHHVGSHAHSFDSIAPSLAGAFRTLAVDLRGHGDSDWAPDGAYTTEDYAGDVIGVIEALSAGPVHLLGGSLGGRVAMVVAGQRPDLVRRLVVEDVGPERPPEIAQRLQQRIREDPVSFASVDEVVERLRPRYPLCAQEALRHIAAHAVRPAPDGRLVWKRDPATARDLVPVSLWRYVERIVAPTLIVLGAESTIVPPAMAHRMLALMDSSRLATIPGAGHNVFLDQPQAFLTMVTSFLGGDTLVQRP